MIFQWFLIATLTIAATITTQAQDTLTFCVTFFCPGYQGMRCVPPSYDGYTLGDSVRVHLMGSVGDYNSGDTMQLMVHPVPKHEIYRPCRIVLPISEGGGEVVPERYYRPAKNQQGLIHKDNSIVKPWPGIHPDYPEGK